MNKKIILWMIVFLIVSIITIPLISARGDTIDYTESSVKFCSQTNNTKTCKLRLDMGITFIEEENCKFPKCGIKRKEAKSFKGSNINCIVDYDGYNKAKCIDWNETSRTIRFSVSESRWDLFILSLNGDTLSVPLRKYSLEYNETLKLMDKKYKTISKEELTFQWYNIEKEFTIKSNSNEIIEFGEYSTTIRLNESNQLTDDANTISGSPDLNAGSATSLTIQQASGNDYKTYIKFNISEIPSGQLIEDAQLYMYNLQTYTAEATIGIYHVYANWSEDFITYNNGVCGVSRGISNSTACNLTFMAEVVNATQGGKNTWWNWTVKDAIRIQYTKGINNVSFVANFSEINAGGTVAYGFHSKEGTAGLRPVLNITYSVEVFAPTVELQSPNNSTIRYFDSANFTYNVSDRDGDNIDNCTLYINGIAIETDTSITQIINQTFNRTGLSVGQKLWKVGCWDDTSSQGNSSEFNLTIKVDSPIITNVFPADYTESYSPYVNFTFNTTTISHSITSCDLFINDILNITDVSITEDINQTFNLTNLPYGDSLWLIQCTSSEGYIINSTEWNYSRETAYPVITSQAPENNTKWATKYLNFTYNVSVPYGSIDTCSLWLNYQLNSTDNSITQIINQTFNLTLNNTHYNKWNIECNSNYNINLNSTISSFVYNTPPTTPTFIRPINNTIMVGTEINLTCSNSTDLEDIPNYEFYGGVDKTSLPLLQNKSSTTYTWSGLTDNNYYWRCRANDNISISGWTAIRRIIHIGASSFNVSHNRSCTSGLTPAMCFDFKDEENLTSLSASIDYNFEINLTNSSVLKIYGSHDSINNTCFCINSTLYSNYSLAYGEIQYEKSSYVDRRYYAFSNTRLTNIQINDTLFLLLNGKSTSFLFEFISTALSPYENHYATLNRWYPDLDTYDTVDMGKTDNKGQTIMHVVSEDVDYRIGLYRTNGILIKLLDPIRFACLDSPCTYSALIVEEPLDYVEFLNIEKSLTYSSGIFTLVYNDPSQNTEEMSLKVYKETGTSTLELCTDSATGYTGILTCNVSIYTGQLRAIAYRTASPAVTIAQLIISTTSTIFKGGVGLFLSLFIFLVLVFIGSLYGPVPTLVFGVIALIPAVVFGALTTGVVIGIGTLVGIAIHFMKRSGR